MMAIGAQDPVLGVYVMEALRAQIRGCPEPMVLAQAGHFVQEHGEEVARAAVGYFAPVTQQTHLSFLPSSAVRNKAAVRRGVARLKALGHEVELDPAVFATHMRFAGDDETRLAAIARAAASGADVAIITRGGYGLTRLLPRLPYKAIAKAIDRGTQFVGLSDFTAFQNAVLAETGRVTWSGPALGEDFGVEAEPDEIMQACFEDLVSGQGEGTGWRLPAAERTERPLQQQGVLWGGNLAIVAALAGTPWMPAPRAASCSWRTCTSIPTASSACSRSCSTRVCCSSRRRSSSASSPTGCRCRMTRASGSRRWWTGCARR